MKKRKFPNDVARFFNPQKSGTNAEYNKFGFLVKPGTNQAKKMEERSYIPVYNAGGTARKVIEKYGEVTYAEPQSKSTTLRLRRKK